MIRTYNGPSIRFLCFFRKAETVHPHKDKIKTNTIRKFQTAIKNSKRKKGQNVFTTLYSVPHSNSNKKRTIFREILEGEGERVWTPEQNLCVFWKILTYFLKCKHLCYQHQIRTVVLIFFSRISPDMQPSKNYLKNFKCIILDSYIM